MPRSKSFRVCAQPGCPTLSEGSWCDVHKPEPWSGNARRKLRAGSGWQEQREARTVKRRDGGRCYLCGNPAQEVDHVIPLAEGGQDTTANKAGICKLCHVAKTTQEAARGRRRGTPV